MAGTKRSGAGTPCPRNRGSPFVVSLSRTRKVPRGFSGLSSSRSDSRRVIFPKYHLREGSHRLSTRPPRAPWMGKQPSCAADRGHRSAPGLQKPPQRRGSPWGTPNKSWGWNSPTVGSATGWGQSEETHVDWKPNQTKPNPKKSPKKYKRGPCRFCPGGEGQERGKSARWVVVFCFFLIAFFFFIKKTV